MARDCSTIRMAGRHSALFTSARRPKMIAREAADPALIEDLVAANRILYDQGVVDGFGHVSVRHDKRREHFLLARSMAPGLVAAADIMEFDREGDAVDPQGRTPYLERFIHSEIFKTRPEVQAVVHSHSPSVIPFGVVAVGLQPIYHMSSFLGAACRSSRSARPAGRRPTC